LSTGALTTGVLQPLVVSDLLKNGIWREAPGNPFSKPLGGMPFTEFDVKFNDTKAAELDLPDSKYKAKYFEYKGYKVAAIHLYDIIL
jgi:alpha-N-acetylglucosamine transferase